MDQREKSHQRITHDRHDDDNLAGDSPSGAAPAENLRAEGQRLVQAAEASLARAASIDGILDEELSRSTPSFLTSIQQASGQ